MKKEEKKETKKVEEKPKEIEKQVSKEKNPIGIKIISFLYFASSLFILLFSVIFMIGSGILKTILTKIPIFNLPQLANSAGNVFLFVGISFLFISAITFAVGIGLWKNLKWSKISAIAISGIGLILSLILIFNGGIFIAIPGILFNGIIGFYLVKLEIGPRKAKTQKKEQQPTAQKKKVERNFEKDLKKFAPFMFGFFLIIGILIYVLTKNVANSILVFLAPSILLGVYLALRDRLKRFNELKKMEEVFPDFISLMSSNLRAGMTIDRALLLSSRKEFSPLDKEIVLVGKDILTAREITKALEDMAVRIGSEEIKKTIQIIVSGLRSGGNLSVILEETASNMRERMFVQKRASSNVLMYVIFIFFAVSIGAPLLFGLSNVLVEVMTGIFSEVGSTQSAGSAVPFSFSEVQVSTTFIFYFSLTFIVAMCLMASLMLGLVSKGKEREGLKYIIPLLIISISVFLISRIFLLKNFSGVI